MESPNEFFPHTEESTNKRKELGTSSLSLFVNLFSGND